MGNNKGLITWIMTLVTLILSVGVIAAAWSVFATSLTPGSWDAGAIVALIWGIVSVLGAIYLWWHGILILIGKESNTWTFVIVAAIATALIGGVLMLIAKLLN